MLVHDQLFSAVNNYIQSADPDDSEMRRRLPQSYGWRPMIFPE